MYSDWFARADERRRRIAVGARRYALVQGQEKSPGWESFLDPTSGQLLPLATLRAETPTQRRERVAKVRALVANRREQLRKQATGRPI